MVKLRPYVVAVNHVPGCPRLESGQGGRKQGRRRCAPGCEHVTDGWEVDLALRLPDGTAIRERVKAPVSGKSAALRWAQEREGQILAQKGRKPKEARQVPTVAEFKPRFIEGHVKANRLKPSSAEAYESISARTSSRSSARCGSTPSATSSCSGSRASSSTTGWQTSPSTTS